MLFSPAPIDAVAVTGPTASGKTALAVELARRLNGEIVSADSRQVYRGMDLGTGKDLEEYGEVPYHLIDVADPVREDYHLARFAAEARSAVAAIAARGRLPVISGGSPLYLDALISGYLMPGGPPDPRERARLDAMSVAELAAELEAAGAPPGFKDWDNRNRLRRAIEIAASPQAGEAPGLRLRTLLLGVYRPRAEVHRRIGERLDARLEAGMVDEVKRLHDAGVSWEKLEHFGLEYREIARHLRGETDFDTMRATLAARIRQFAKRQDIWFRKMEREGHVIYWLDADRAERAAGLVRRFLAREPLPEPELRMDDIRY